MSITACASQCESYRDTATCLACAASLLVTMATLCSWGYWCYPSVWEPGSLKTSALQQQQQLTPTSAHHLLWISRRGFTGILHTAGIRQSCEGYMRETPVFVTLSSRIWSSTNQNNLCVYLMLARPWIHLRNTKDNWRFYIPQHHWYLKLLESIHLKFSN